MWFQAQAPPLSRISFHLVKDVYPCVDIATDCIHKQGFDVNNKIDGSTEMSNVAHYKKMGKKINFKNSLHFFLTILKTNIYSGSLAWYKPNRVWIQPIVLLLEYYTYKMTSNVCFSAKKNLH